jgi:hypothetical protein
MKVDAWTGILLGRWGKHVISRSLVRKRKVRIQAWQVLVEDRRTYSHMS